MTHADAPMLKRLTVRLTRRARQLVPCPQEADDLVQDALLAAVQTGRAWEAPTTEPWLRGVLWRRAAFLARSAGRRRRREAAVVSETSMGGGAPPHHRPTTAMTTRPVPRLPPSLRIVARLALAGCTRDEIRWLLAIRPAALRQRIAALRRSVEGTSPPPSTPSPVVPGPVRRSVLPLARRFGGVGAHDPDGHPILVGCSRSRGPRQP